MLHNDQDWALVVGLSVYKGLTDLRGPEHDARDFYNWVTASAPEGGGVPVNRRGLPDQAKLILSSHYPGPFARIAEARPAAEQLADWVDEVDQVALENQKARKGRCVGRRLYLYLSGHGIAPTLPGQAVHEESALLMANAGEGRYIRHIPGRLWVDWFYRAGYFSELILFMDCCRDVPVGTALAPFPLDTVENRRARGKIKRFLAFATRWNSRSRERPMPALGNQVRGVFTAALMKGLRGAAARPEDGQITAESLKSYLIQNYKEWLAPEDLSLPDLLQEPEIEVPSNSGDLLFASAATAPAIAVPGATPAAPTFPVVIEIPAGLTGRTLQILDADFRLVSSIVAAPPKWEVPLQRRLYKLITVGGGPEQFIEVNGMGTVHVQL